MYKEEQDPQMAKIANHGDSHALQQVLRKN